MTSAIFPDLRGKSVFITGGGGGIGASLTKGFLKQGAKVAFVDLNDSTEYCDALEKETGNRPFFQQCDISNVDALQTAMKNVAKEQGDIQILVNNAANDQRHDYTEVDEEFWDWCIGVNMKAYFFAMQQAAPAMQKAGGGSIINFTSTSFMMAQGGMPLYTSSNSSLVGMTRSFARDLGPDAVRVNAVAPGWIMTERQLKLWANPEAVAKNRERQCLKREMEPDDLLGGVFFLASDASTMVTGQVIAIDAGATYMTA